MSARALAALLVLALAGARPAPASPLLDAARDGDAARATELVREGADVAAAGAQGDTPLHWAAWHGYAPLVELLIDRGAAVNAAVANGNTPLHQAAYAGALAVVEVLVEAGADLDATDRGGMTPADWAARNGHREVVRFLAARGADVDADALDAQAPDAQPRAPGGLTARLGALPSVVLRGPDIQHTLGASIRPALTLERAGPEAGTRARPGADAQRESEPGPEAAAAMPETLGPADGPTAWIQLGAYRSEREARRGWTRIARVSADLLARFEPVISTAELPSRGQYHRLRVGPLSKHEADGVCAQLRERRTQCLVLLARSR